MTEPTPPSEQRPKGSMITNYFMVILFAFGCVQLFMNVQHDTIDNQRDHIAAFQRKHFVKSNSASRKVYPKDDGETPAGGVEGKFSAKNAENEEEVDYREEAQNEHHLAGLSCDRFGGPADASEMVFWEDIPSDNTFISPFQKPGKKQYLTFEADHGGWNNIRMSMETVMTLAVAMGRTLVLPPAQKMYLLSKEKGHKGDKQSADFSFADFFHMESIADEHMGLEVITMKQFLEREGLGGNLRDMDTDEVLFPPGNQTAYDGASHGVISGKLEKYLQRVGITPSWNPENCVAAFPATTDPADVQALKDTFNSFGTKPSYAEYIGKPVPIAGPPKERMMEMWADRKDLCIYDEEMQSTQLLHFGEGAKGAGSRLLVHYYAFLFFQDWKQDLWMKRFVRDHVRYIDEIQCAAARIIAAIRERAIAKGLETGDYNAYHIRRGDFQYSVVRYEAPKILQNSMKEMTPGGVVYIATDEKDKKFFDPFRENFDVVFLEDFHHLLEGVNSNYFGMIDTLIASRSEVFFGCWFSTFTGYIHRLRGYHANKRKAQGWEHGIIENSFYYALDDRIRHMQEYYPVKKSFYAREFPTAWRMLDIGIGEMDKVETA